MRADEELGVSIEAAAGKAELTAIHQQFEGLGDTIECPPKRRKSQSARHLDHVCRLMAKLALRQPVVEQLHLGVAVIRTLRNLIAGNGKHLDRLVAWIL